MPEYDELLLTVRTRSVFHDPADAQLAISAVAGSLAACLDDPVRERLPLDAARSARSSDARSGEPRPGDDALALSVDGFLAEVARRTGWSPERARYAAQAVLSALAEHDPELRPAVVRRLPEAAALFTSPGAPA